MPHLAKLCTQLNLNTLPGRRYSAILAAMETEYGQQSALDIERMQRAAMLLVVAEQMRKRAMEGQPVNMSTLLSLEAAADRALGGLKRPRKPKGPPIAS